ncbi:class I SAM-dependent methyltransferase [Paenibacillus senegalensis]|uniref:class I SAM-dependent methyltransferase n=1 Tax=Paenibacillus senegalensis TaxID=1465766 RepID=UPI00028993F8|nr:class I SAM-dependent methyltransferase [Paenibacillus senegalensis]
MNDEKLLQFYLNLRSSEAGPWNLSPENLYIELEVRHHIRELIYLHSRLNVCNIGIGTGEWDDYLGYILTGRGNITSVDIDNHTCELFQYRQKIESHPNPSKVLCENILETSLNANSFDIVTIIGSTVREIGQYNRTLETCFKLLKPGGQFFYMDFEKNYPIDLFEQWAQNANHEIETVIRLSRYEVVESFITIARKGM